MQPVLPHNELYDLLAKQGWRLKKMDFVNNQYVAKGEGPNGQKVDRTGNTKEMALYNLLSFAMRSNLMRQNDPFQPIPFTTQRIAAWNNDWTNKHQHMAEAYRDMPTFDEKAVKAWRALAAESRAQADSIRRQVKVELTPDPHPYKDAEEMRNDVHRNKKLKISTANLDHPIWTKEDIINFRIAHNVLGFAHGGEGFDWEGENAAAKHHLPMISPLAREAYVPEVLGQHAHYKNYGSHGDQKIGFMSQFLHPMQDQQGEHVYAPSTQHGLPEFGSKGDPKKVKPKVGGWQVVSETLTHAPPRFDIGDTVTDGYAPMAHVINRAETPSGWVYRLDSGNHEYDVMENQLEPASNFVTASEKPEKWITVEGIL